VGRALQLLRGYEILYCIDLQHLSVRPNFYDGVIPQVQLPLHKHQQVFQQHALFS